MQDTSTDYEDRPTSKKEERNSGSILEELHKTVQSIEISTRTAQPSNETEQQAGMAIAIAKGNPIHLEKKIYDCGQEVKEHDATMERITKLETALTGNSETIATLELHISGSQKIIRELTPRQQQLTEQLEGIKTKLQELQSQITEGQTPQTMPTANPIDMDDLTTSILSSGDLSNLDKIIAKVRNTSERHADANQKDQAISSCVLEYLSIQQSLDANNTLITKEESILTEATAKYKTAEQQKQQLEKELKELQATEPQQSKERLSQEIAILTRASTLFAHNNGLNNQLSDNHIKAVIESQLLSLEKELKTITAQEEALEKKAQSTPLSLSIIFRSMLLFSTFLTGAISQYNGNTSLTGVANSILKNKHIENFESSLFSILNAFLKLSDTNPRLALSALFALITLSLVYSSSKPANHVLGLSEQKKQIEKSIQGLHKTLQQIEDVKSTVTEATRILGIFQHGELSSYVKEKETETFTQ